MDKLVCYSLFAPPDEPRPDLLRQLVTSVQTLRQYNRTVPVALFVQGGAPPELPPSLAPYDVRLCAQEPYAARLARLCPAGWPALAHYPLLHKFLNFAAVARLGPRQALFLDCDTLFFDDVARLFDGYAEAHCYAREEPTCARSHYGYDPDYLDEGALASLAAAAGVQPLPPFNLGVVLFNHGIWPALAAIEGAFVDYAWRLLVWLAANPSEERSARYGEMKPVQLLRQHLDWLAASGELRRALPFPSANEWILDQVALWLALGRLDGLTYGDLWREHALQNGECLAHDGPRPDWVLCHYYSQNMSRMEQWLLQTAAPATRH